jgi:phospholipid transport system substrate-binding protein
MKKILTVITFLIIILSSISKVYSIEADIFVQSTVNRASEALKNKYSKEEKIEKLKQIASETVDINGIGYYTLGAYRKNISANEINQYEMLFEHYFLKSFASRLAE